MKRGLGFLSMYGWKLDLWLFKCSRSPFATLLIYGCAKKGKPDRLRIFSIMNSRHHLPVLPFMLFTSSSYLHTHLHSVRHVISFWDWTDRKEGRFELEVSRAGTYVVIRGNKGTSHLLPLFLLHSASTLTGIKVIETSLESVNRHFMDGYKPLEWYFVRGWCRDT